jgi:hypothetical protein
MSGILPEPWELASKTMTARPYIVASCDGRTFPNPRHVIVAGTPTGGGPEWVNPWSETVAEHARRIVAAVNACAGITTDRLEKLSVEALKALLDRYDIETSK